MLTLSFRHELLIGSSSLHFLCVRREQSPAGVALTVWVFVVYRLACIFEGYV